MTEVHFHYANNAGAMVDRCKAIVSDFADTRAYAELIVRSLIARPGMEDWRGVRRVVQDDAGPENFRPPFPALAGLAADRQGRRWHGNLRPAFRVRAGQAALRRRR